MSRQKGKRIIKGYLIDPTTPADPLLVAALELDDEGEIPLKTLYKHLDCEMVEIVRLSNGNIMFVDEEALLKPGPRHAFSLTGFMAQPFVIGKALIVGSDPVDGHLKPTTMQATDFLGKLQVGTLRTTSERAGA